MGSRRRFEAPIRAVAVTAVTVFALLAAPTPALADSTFSITSFTASPDSAPAGSHPDSTVHMVFGGTDSEDVKTIIQHFPGGIIPNPYALPQCTKAEFATTPPSCPSNSQLGTTTLVAKSETLGSDVPVDGQVYNLQVDPPFAGGLGFVVAGSPLAAPFTVRSATFGAIPGLLTDPPGLTTSLPNVEPDINDQPIMPTRRDYGLTGISVNVPRSLNLGLGLDNIKIKSIDYTLDGTPTTTVMCGSDPCPYLTTTTACMQGYPELEATEYDDPATTDVDESLVKVHRVGNILSSTAGSCAEDRLPYNPDPLDVALGSHRTDTPSSYDLSINIPANENWGSGNDRHQPYLRKGSITFPEGTALSPPAAQGLVGCTDAEIGIGTQADPNCPSGSDIGDVTVVSKNVDHVIHGNFYQGEPMPGHTYRVFIAFEVVDGLWIKLDGESFPDPDTGQVTTVFDELPMLPFEKFTVALKGGDRAVLVNPHDCGSNSVTSTLTPWSGATTFPSSRDKHPSSPSFNISYDGSGAACPDPFPFNPTISGTTDPLQGGGRSKLSLTLDSPDRDQLVKTLTNSLPPGLAGGIVGIPLCSISDAAAGTCSEDSKIGSIDTSVGSGNDPLPLPGKIYIADPIQPGDPASLSIVVPNKAGPFDFGNTVLRARIVLRSDYGLDVVLADDLPRIVEGIPIRLRTAGVNIDRDNFIRNPTSCAAQQLAATFTSREDTTVTSTTPYQATGCDTLPFAPKLRLAIRGETKKDGHPTLDAILTQADGEANILKSVVVLPDVIRPEVLALQRPGGLCQEAQALTRTCPSTSMVGVAKATTPLLPEPLSGPVYIVQHSGNPLPKLVVFLDGRVSIKLEAQNGFQGLKIVNTFDNLPDLPVSSFELTISGGKNGILKNFVDLCKKDNKGDATFTAHSGKTFTDHPLIETPLNTRGCVSTSEPRASLTLKGVASGAPVLSLRVRRGPSGAKLRSMSLTLPRSLEVNAKKARRGALVRGSRKLSRSQWRLTRRGVLTLRRLPRAGFASIRALLKKGVLKPDTALRVAARRHKLKNLSFKLRVVDVQNRRFNITLRVKPRS
jgi:hypothetical protein